MILKHIRKKYGKDICILKILGYKDICKDILSFNLKTKNKV